MGQGDAERIIERSTRAGETMNRLAARTDLLDVSDPAFQDILYSVSIQAAMRGQDENTARIFASVGYIAGRLRGRKEAAMQAMLGEEKDT